jgi:hypothetical protein
MERERKKRGASERRRWERCGRLPGPYPRGRGRREEEARLRRGDDTALRLSGARKKKAKRKGIFANNPLNISETTRTIERGPFSTVLELFFYSGAYR